MFFGYTILHSYLVVGVHSVAWFPCGCTYYYLVFLWYTLYCTVFLCGVHSVVCYSSCVICCHLTVNTVLLGIPFMYTELHVILVGYTQ
jgi:hypothetical protein